MYEVIFLFLKRNKNLSHSFEQTDTLNIYFLYRRHSNAVTFLPVLQHGVYLGMTYNDTQAGELIFETANRASCFKPLHLQIEEAAKLP